MARNIYTPTDEECEEKLAQLIVRMKAEIADLRTQERAAETISPPQPGEKRPAWEIPRQAAKRKRYVQAENSF